MCLTCDRYPINWRLQHPRRIRRAAHAKGDAASKLVMYVLQTHPRIFVNRPIITNLHYVPASQFLARVKN